MSELSVTDARSQFPSVISDAANEPVRITRHGKDVAIVINPSLYETLMAAQEELEDLAAFDEAQLETAPNIPWEQVHKDLNLR